MRKRFGRYRGAVAAVVVAAVLAAGGIATAEKPVTITEGNTQTTFNVGVSPDTLPRKKPAPVTFAFSATFRTSDGGNPPAARRILIESQAYLDRRLKEVPVCRVPEAPQWGDNWERCERAIVGFGVAQFDPPDGSLPVIPTYRETLVAYNGGRVNGKWRLWLRYRVSYADPPYGVGRMDVKRIDQGPYRLRSVLVIPDAGEGRYLSRLILPLSKVFAVTCPRHRFRARITAVLADRGRPTAEISQPCTPR